MKKTKIFVLLVLTMIGTFMVTRSANAEDVPIEIRTPNDLMAINLTSLLFFVST